MKRILLLAILCGFVIALNPATTLAKPKNDSHGSGHGEQSSPSAKSSAYEHASDQSSFERGTHDMGKNQEQQEATENNEGKSREKNKGKDNKTDTDKDKKEAETVKDKGKETKHNSDDKPHNKDK